MTKVYLICRDKLISEEYASKLCSWRYAVYERLRNDKSRQESLTAGLLFGCALFDNGIDVKTEKISVLPAGKPVFSDKSDIYFSLSHSGPWAMCAVSDAPVGVDIQESRTVKQTLARRFHPMEAAYLDSLDDIDWYSEFFRLWTRKEAWVKAYSKDRFLSLQECSVLGDMENFYFTDYKPADGIFASVCTTHKDVPEFISVSSEQLLRFYL